MAHATHSLSPDFWQRLNWLRGLLSVYVMVHHAVQLVWPGWESAAAVTPSLEVPARLGSVSLHFGVHAVLVFFVVSGASIHARVAERGTEAPFDARDYFRRRLRRLYPALLFSMAVSAGLAFFIDDPGLNLTDFVGTLLFQQQVVTGMFAGNVPYWSLSFEGYYYVLYLLFLGLYRRQGRAVYVSLGALGLLAGVVGGRVATVLSLYPVWLAGAALVDLRAAGKRLPTAAVVALALLFASAVPHYLWFGLSADSSVLPWMVFGVGAFGLVEGWARTPWLDGKQSRVLDVCGDLSYSLYLNHYLVFRVLGHAWPADPAQLWRSAALTLLGSAISFGLAALSFYGLERRFLQPRVAV